MLHDARPGAPDANRTVTRTVTGAATVTTARAHARWRQSPRASPSCMALNSDGTIDDRDVPRTFTFGFVRQLDAVAVGPLTNAWAAGAGPGNADMVIDLDAPGAPKPDRGRTLCSASTRDPTRDMRRSVGRQAVDLVAHNPTSPKGRKPSEIGTSDRFNDPQHPLIIGARTLCQPPGNRRSRSGRVLRKQPHNLTGGWLRRLNKARHQGCSGSTPGAQPLGWRGRGQTGERTPEPPVKGSRRPK